MEYLMQAVEKFLTWRGVGRCMGIGIFRLLSRTKVSSRP
jgi:hypothetical protein